MNIILIGAQGSGKGTQAALLSQSLQVRHVSSGDLFRQAFEEKTMLGLQAKAFVDRGELVPDDITVAMVLNYIKEQECQEHMLLDGFPRTIPQAQALDKGLAGIGRQIDVTVYLDVPRQELIKRLTGRSICRAQQHIYHRESHPPKVAGICDLDGSELYQRSDDAGEAVERRLTIFFNQTMQILNYYDAQQKLVAVDGNKSVEQVHATILEAIAHQMQPKKELIIEMP